MIVPRRASARPPRPRGAPVVAVFAVEDTTVQLQWRHLVPGLLHLRVPDAGIEVTVEVTEPAGATVLTGLLPGRRHRIEVRGSALADSGGSRPLEATTLRPPPGAEVCRIATISDLHLGTEVFGHRGTITERPRPEVPHPTRCAQAAIGEATAWGAQHLVVKGDITNYGKADEWRTYARLVADATVAVDGLVGNHDRAREARSRGAVPPEEAARLFGLSLAFPLLVRDLPGLRIVMADTTIPGRNLGHLAAVADDLLDAVADAERDQAVLVAIHHQLQPWPVAEGVPAGIPRHESLQLLEHLARAHPRVLVTSGHTHRHRRWSHAGVTTTQVGATKDYPGVWGGYVVHEGGIRQLVRRIARPDCIRWTEHTRRAAVGRVALRGPRSAEQPLLHAGLAGPTVSPSPSPSGSPSPASSSPAGFEPPRRNPLLVQLGDVGLAATPETWVVQARRLVPFALLWLVAICLPLVLPDSVARPGWLAASGLVALLTGLSILFTPASVGYREWRILPVISVCLAVMMLTYGSGGTSRGYGQVLLVLPVIWQGIYGRRRDTVLAVVVAAAALIAPMVVFDGYPVDVELPRAVVLVLVAAVVGAVLQSLMRSLRANDQVLIHLSTVVRDLYAADDPRTLLCETVASLAGAPVAVLVERREGALVLTAAVGFDLTEDQPTLAMEHANGRGRALDTGRLVFEAEVAADRVIPGSRLHVPIGSREAPTAVVTAIWPTAHPEPPSIVLGALALVGADAGVALERTDLVEQLEEQAHRDGLTGLPNRREWDEVLDREIARAQRSGRPLALAVLDLDHFKDFNDRHGHLAGDDLLREAAGAWRASLRAPDLIARWGGEEFAVLFPDSTAEEAALVLRRLRSVTPGEQTFSAGVVRYESGERPESLMAAADALMYEAKSLGRDQVRQRPEAEG